ncbi:hypothetical protein BVC71_05740 [Marivivens niveibacter]|uniref:Lipoprotein n=1 Tax=Marivivens niveibacter TaxID=1930667 RepID=A0A251X477_9RHOB|nr:hypothetical protein [Marivivens niveibacter]OUD10963.1 hypothetical protein BVC71_05740 [Marivivens niveibacter]
MLRQIGLAACVLITISGCARISQSRLNPLNWFGPAEPAAVATEETVIRPLIPQNRAIVFVDERVPADQVTSLAIERTNDGAIIRATALVTGQPYNAELVLLGLENGTATYAFVTERGASTGQQSVTVAKSIDTAELAQIRRVVVQGQNGSLQTTR